MGSKRRGPLEGPGCPNWGAGRRGGIRPQVHRPVRDHGQGPRPHHRPRHANDYASNNQWNREDNTHFMPQMPAVWNRNMITLNNGSGTRDNYQVAQSSSNYQYSRYAIRNPPYQHQQNLAPYPWIPPSRPPLLSPPVPPCYNEQKVGSQNFGKPLDKTITDTIDQVKRKLKERKLSESQKEKINSSTESSFEEHSNNKAIEKKRIEHVKMSPKISVTKKFSKKDDLKNVSNMTTEKSNQQQKSQTLRKNILKQLFKLDKNNLQEILSNPESSNKYSCALSSLIKDTRISISKELRNVAEKSLQFHNISANSEQGEKIVQNAFLGHLETLLDNSSSLELFNMEPQLINELSKVLRQDLMGSMNEICLENLRDVMHESIMEEAKDQKYPLELTNVDNLNFDFTDESNFIKKEIDENSCNDFSLCIKNENYDSDCEDQIISTNPLNYGEGPQPVDQGSEEFEKRLQSIKIENNKIETVKFSPLTSSDSGCSQNFKENTSPGKSDETFREQILRNFDIATNKYETGTNSSNKPKKRKHNETNSLNDKWKQSTSKSDYFNDNNTFSYAPENSSRTETKINISAVPQIESTNLKSRNTNSYSKVETLNPIDSNTHAFPKDIVIPQNKNLHNFTHLNSAQNSNSFSNKIANAETISNNTHETKKKDESSLKFSEDCKRDNESHSSNHLQNNSTYQNKVSITTALQNIENANYNKNIQTDRKLPKNPLDIHTSEKYNNHKTDKRNLKFKRSRFDKSNSIIDDNKTKKVTDSSQMNLTNAELKGKGKIVTDKRMKTIKSSQIENQIDKMCTDTNDLSSVVNKIVENNHSKNISFPKNNMKNQGTQYIDFKKTNVSTQIYASLISSKSKGCQACKINMKDIHCQTSVHISEQDVNKMKEYKEMVNKACQTDLFTELDKTNNPKNLVSKEVETSDIPTDKNFLSKEKNQNDALSKMKLIDNEIHQLLQNRYELYKSLQSTSFLTDGNGDRFNFKLRHIPNLSDYNKSNLDSQIKKYNTQVKNSLSHSIEKASAVDNNSISNRVICNKSKSQKSKKQSSVHSTKHKSTEKSKKSCSGSSLPINNDALSKMHKSDKIKESKDNFSTINNKEVTSESTDKNKVLSVDNNCNSSYLELRNNTPCNKLKNESLNCLDHQNTPIINKKISPKESFHNKIVCKRKPKSINKNFKDSKDRMKKTPLSILISELNDSDDEIDDLDVKNVPKENENRLNINIPKENPILNLRKKYNIKNCSVKLEPVNIQKRYLKENINSHSDNDLIHEKISPNLSNRNFSISLDEIDDVFENLTDPDIPSMLENIRGNETMALVDNWDSQLFENVTLSESVNVFADEGNSPEITTVTSNPTDVCLSKNEDTLQVSDESKSFTDNSESSENTISLNDHTDSIIAIEYVGSTFLAASLDGNVYFYCANTGMLLRKFYCSELAVTCLWVKENTVYTGSFDANLKCFDLDMGEEISNCNVGSPIQSMTLAWDTIYIGTKTGYVVQYDIKSMSLVPDGAIKFSDQTILAINAIKEGPRKVLLIASRSQDVTVKDAKTGLLLRTFHGPITTVYSLLFNSGKVFCGTSSCLIQAFDFVTGDVIKLYNGGNGAVCLKMHNGLLFAGCYDGFIYVFKLNDEKPFATIPGPGKMLLAMSILGNKIIAGCKDKSLCIWNIPKLVIDEMSH